MTADKTLCGSWAQLWVDGVPVGELKNIVIDVRMIRRDVQIGLDVDSKLVGMKGEGSMTLYKMYTRFADELKEMQKGADYRFKLIAKLEDPDALDSQVERYSIDNVAFTRFPLASWRVGETVEQEIPFTFTPSDLKKLDGIEAAG